MIYLPKKIRDVILGNAFDTAITWPCINIATGAVQSITSIHPGEAVANAWKTIPSNQVVSTYHAGARYTPDGRFVYCVTKSECCYYRGDWFTIVEDAKAEELLQPYFAGDDVTYPGMLKYLYEHDR